MDERDVRIEFQEKESWRVCGEQALRNIMTVDGGSAHVMRTSGQIFLGEGARRFRPASPHRSTRCARRHALYVL